MFPLYSATALVFLLLDAVMLRLVLKPLLLRNLRGSIREVPRRVPATVFYLAYVLALIWLVSAPAIAAGGPPEAALRGAVIGAMAYGTYELTSMSVIKGWSWRMVATGTTWGMALTGFSAWAGVVITLRYG